jgi:hypothetical protein
MLGVIAAPRLGIVWRGVVGRGAERLHLAAGAAPHQASGRCAIHTRRRPAAGFVAMNSPSHLKDLELAASYLRGEGSEVDRLGHPLTRKVARLYEILSSDALYARLRAIVRVRFQGAGYVCPSPADRAEMPSPPLG